MMKVSLYMAPKICAEVNCQDDGEMCKNRSHPKADIMPANEISMQFENCRGTSRLVAAVGRVRLAMLWEVLDARSD